MKRITILLACLFLFVGVGSAFHILVIDFEDQENPYENLAGMDSTILNEGIKGDYSLYVNNPPSTANQRVNISDNITITANNQWYVTSLWKVNTSFPDDQLTGVESQEGSTFLAYANCEPNGNTCHFASQSDSNLFDESMELNAGYWYKYNISYNGSHVKVRALNYSKSEVRRNMSWDFIQEENYGSIESKAVTDMHEATFYDEIIVQADVTVEYGLCRAQHDNMGDIFTCFLLNVPYLFIVVGALISALVSFGLKRSSASLDTGYVCIGIGLAWVIFIWLIGFFEIYLVAVTLLITGLIIFHKNL